MQRKSAMRGWVLVVVVGVVACAAPVMEQDSATQYSSLGKYCGARAQAECNTQVVTHCGVKDPAACVQKRTSACMADTPQGATYEPARALACVEAVKTAYASATLTKDALAAMDTACALIWSGPGTARAPCSVDLDCSSKDGLRCVIPLGQTAGKCLRPSMVPPAAPCPGEADQCPSDYYCQTKSQVCVSRGAEGSQCNRDSMPCLPGLYCSGALFITACKPLATAGSPCDTGGDCADGLCDKASSSSKGTCSAAITLSPLDARCVNYR